MHILTCGVGVYMPYIQPAVPLKFHVIMVYIHIIHIFITYQLFPMDNLFAAVLSTG